MWGALASSAASVYGAMLSAKAQQKTNTANLDAQDKANLLSVDLANTSHQREVQDLRAANLNPILSAGGSGASSPQLQAASVESPGQSFGNAAGNVGRELSRAMATSTNLDNRQRAANIESQGLANQNAAIDLELNSAQKEFDTQMIELKNDALNKYLYPAYTVKEPGSYHFTTHLDRELGDKRRAELESTMIEGIKSELKNKEWSFFRSWLPFINQGANSASSLFRPRSGPRTTNIFYP